MLQMYEHILFVYMPSSHLKSSSANLKLIPVAFDDASPRQASAFSYKEELANLVGTQKRSKVRVK